MFFVYIIWESLGGNRGVLSSVNYNIRRELIIESPFPAHTNVESCKVIRGVVML